MGRVYAEQRWERIAGVCETPGGEGAPVWGVQVRWGEMVPWVYPDVSTQATEAQELAERLQRAQPEPCHWQDIVEEYIHEIAGL